MSGSGQYPYVLSHKLWLPAPAVLPPDPFPGYRAAASAMPPAPCFSALPAPRYRSIPCRNFCRHRCPSAAQYGSPRHCCRSQSAPHCLTAHPHCPVASAHHNRRITAYPAGSVPYVMSPPAPVCRPETSCLRKLLQLPLLPPPYCLR